ncbi:unnamed protein product [Bursaphelenchus okinawaensis]|uniref:WD repeat-containing protein 54 beta-propeller domain-containing protein n=1 Tax=Bursaphelenchus okinawaensis TaxID=465554 RepID=A0A811KJK9_9BILA|nr:unnamed protein product [Bursaphelenchus okinawaensis]CAG9104257.1 unnamed protein product [Bursaphelenchus okinawaensis]
MDTEIAISGPIPPKNPYMFETDREMVVPLAPSFLPNNLSVHYHESKFTTYACYCSKNNVQLISWDIHMENLQMDSLPLKESGKEKPLTIMQCKICSPGNRLGPVLVVGTVTNVMILDVKPLKILASTPLVNGDEKQAHAAQTSHYMFGRGITCVDNMVLIGSFSGDILMFLCNGENSFNVKSCAPEHKAPIADIATCSYDSLTVSSDIEGLVVVWAKNMKTVLKRIKTNQQISVVNILRKQVFCGNFHGQVVVFSIQTGAQLAELNIHSRQITSIAVAPESAYILTASEDCYVRVWKLYSRHPDCYRIEYRYHDKTDNMPIVGAQFLNGRGNGYAITLFEYPKLPIFIIRKNPIEQGES